MAITEQKSGKTREERLAEILRTHRPLTFEQMLGPEPKPGDAEDLEAFLGYLRLVREPVRIPGALE